MRSLSDEPPEDKEDWEPLFWVCVDCGKRSEEERSFCALCGQVMTEVYRKGMDDEYT
jgi:rRNA maturation endonuclease Nob1